MLRPITINPVLNGFVVQFGCQQLAYTDTTKMLGDIGDYLREPEETEKKILKEECFNRRHTLGVDTLAPAPCPDNGPVVAGNRNPADFDPGATTGQTILEGAQGLGNIPPRLR